jgi:hypothetical protein
MSTNNRHTEPEKLQDTLRHTMPRARPSFERDLELRLLAEFTTANQDKEQEPVTAYDLSTDDAIPRRVRLNARSQPSPLTLAAAVTMLVLVGTMVLALMNSRAPMASTSIVESATGTPPITVTPTSVPITPPAITTGAHQVSLPRARVDMYGMVTLQAWTLVDVMVVTSEYDTAEDITISIQRVASGAQVIPSPDGNLDSEFVILMVDRDTTVQELEMLVTNSRDRMPIFLVPHIADVPQPIQGIMPTAFPRVTDTPVLPTVPPSVIPLEMTMTPVSPQFEEPEPTLPPTVVVPSPTPD